MSTENVNAQIEKMQLIWKIVFIGRRKFYPPILIRTKHNAFTKLKKK